MAHTKNRDDPYVVHELQDWRRLEQAIAQGPRKRGFIARYRARCSGKKVELPPRVRIREDERGPYFAAGPHDRYYVKCESCV